jgi:prevent-host-death family protein
MTKTNTQGARKLARKRPRRKLRSPLSSGGQWMLHEAKARFSELVRMANTVGPQRVTSHGRNEVVVLSAEEYEKLKGEKSGHLLVELMRTSPLRDVEFDSPSVRSPVRDVKL